MSVNNKDKRLADFQKKEEVKEEWTDEELIVSAKRIIKKLNIKGELFKG